MVQPLAYMAYTTVIEENLLAVFGGLSQDLATGKFEVKNEILFLNLETSHW